MKIAVLGASGVAGRAFVPKALASGHSVLIDRVDLFDWSALTNHVRGCDAVVNLVTSIPKPGGPGSWSMNDRIRREGTRILNAACLAADVQVIVQQGIAMLHCEADDRPQTESDPMRGYSVFASALDMEEIVRASMLDIRVVRGGLFYGPQTMREQRWIEEVMDPSFQVPADGKSWVSLVHVDDYASALLHVLERGEPRHPYIACDDEPTRLADLYAMAAARAGVGRLANGGAILTRSFRTSNGKLRGIGWAPAVPQMRL